MRGGGNKCEENQALEQITLGCCAISILGGFWDPTVWNLSNLVWSQSWPCFQQEVGVGTDLLRCITAQTSSVQFWNCFWVIILLCGDFILYFKVERVCPFLRGKMKPSEHLHENGRRGSVSCTQLSLLARVVAPEVRDPASGPCRMTQSRSLHPAPLQMGCKWHTMLFG